jgi:hypothetical protein
MANLKHPWTADEMDRLMVAILNQGKDISWVVVASEVGTRNVRMCRGKWSWEMGGGQRQRRNWTDKEDQLLWKLKFEERLVWSAIEGQFPSRCLNELKNRFKSLIRRTTWKMKVAPIPEVLEDTFTPAWSLPKEEEELLEEDHEWRWTGSDDEGW